ncbi:MAG: ABC transporter substrate-binding protein [Deltaproteobacteria bacterium]|nr:ABC transporter substrate-binding protein [Deltaproteobacteria bacterium]
MKKLFLFVGIFILTGFLCMASNVQAEQQVTVADYGGAWGDVLRKVFYEPFTKETGIKVYQQTPPLMSKLKAMVETGNVEWDLYEGGDSERIPMEQQGFLEKYDYSYIDKETLSGFEEYQKKPYGIYFMGYSTAIAYSKDAFPKGGPKTWADVWDVKRFPGMRCLHSGGGGWGMIEEAMLIEGRPLNKLYPLSRSDWERAFKKFEEINPYVLKWWRAGEEPGRMLRDKEVTVVNSYSGRIDNLIAQGANLAIEYNQGNLIFEMFLIPKGTKNYDAAMKLIAFILRADRQAAMSNMYPNGATNKHAYKHLSPQKAKGLPTSPENMKIQFVRDNDYWGAIDAKTGKSNQELSKEMWAEWALKQK